jgi:hypothetical protein
MAVASLVVDTASDVYAARIKLDAIDREGMVMVIRRGRDH